MENYKWLYMRVPLVEALAASVTAAAVFSFRDAVVGVVWVWVSQWDANSAIF